MNHQPSLTRSEFGPALARTFGFAALAGLVWKLGARAATGCRVAPL